MKTPPFHLPPFDLPPHSIPGLSALIQGDLWSRWTEDGRVFPVDELVRSVAYLRLKPDDSCRLVVFGNRQAVGDTRPLGFYLRLFSDADRALASYEKVRARPGVEDAPYPVFFDPEHFAVGIPFPMDLSLPALRRVFEPDRFRRTLLPLLDEYPEDQWRIKRRSLVTTVLAYKPDRRAVLAVDFECRARDGSAKVPIRIHAKVEESSRAVHNFERAQLVAAALARSNSTAPIARPLGIIPERGFVATAWIDGRSLLSPEEGVALPKETVAADISATGEALAHFHRMEVDLDHCPSPIERAQQILQLGSDLAGLIPDEAERVEDLARQIAGEASQWASLPSGPVHGDFHPGQVLLTPEGATLIDFDRAGRGYAIDDLGNFIAYLLERNEGALRKPFLDSYRTVEPDVDFDLLPLAIAQGLFFRLPAPFRRLDPDWRAQLLERMDQIELHLAGAPS